MNITENMLHISEKEILDMKKNEIKDKFTEIYVNKWKTNISRDRAKLQFYSSLKNNIQFEDYLREIKNPNYRNALVN